MQDELAALLSRNLTLAHPALVHKDEAPLLSIETPALNYSASQHYHHSSHLAGASAPPTSPTIERTSDFFTVEDVLRSNSIEPQSLFPTQLALFKSVAPEQRLRLIQLWRLSPPAYGSHALAQELKEWPITSLEQEESMARLRLERRMLQESNKWGFTEGDGLSDGDIRRTDTPGQPPVSMTALEEAKNAAEPYIVSGYSALAAGNLFSSQPNTNHLGYMQGGLQELAGNGGHYSLSADPVYQGTDSSWQWSTDHRRMENQYGAYAQWNQSGTATPVIDGAGGHDEEMS